MKHYSRHNRNRFLSKNKKKKNSNIMWKFLKNFRCHFTACCKSKCSIAAKDIDGDGTPDIIEISVNDKNGKRVFQTNV